MNAYRRRLLSVFVFVLAMLIAVFSITFIKRNFLDNAHDRTVSKWVHIKSYQQAEPEVNPNLFVKIKDGRFELQGIPFFPVLLNYVPEFRIVEDSLILGPAKIYEQIDRYEVFTLDSVRLQLAGHFQLIKTLGFNSIRLPLDRMAADENGLFFPASNQRVYLTGLDGERLLDAIDGLLIQAEEAGLYVMPLIQTPTKSNDVEAFTEKLLLRFNNRPAVFAYDFLNEPLYDDDTGAEGKADIRAITKKWRVMMDRLAPYQLLTIGLSEPIEVFRWDPDRIDVDFFAFHTYHPLRVPNEIYWYAKYGGKPWMIGETGLPADNDSISYEQQRQFMIESFDRTVDCGGAGYGWWEFQDVPGLGFEGAFTGILNHNDTLKCPNGYVMQKTSRKPVALQVSQLSWKQVPEKGCPCWSNHYNMVGYQNYRVRGKIVDSQTGKAIPSAVIRGWNLPWSIGMNTYTRPDGSFELYSNTRNAHFEISAPSYWTAKFDTPRNLNYKPTTKGVPNEADLPNQELEYHSIDYKPFMRNSPIPDTITDRLFIHDFDPDAFDNAAYESDLGTIELDPIIKQP